MNQLHQDLITCLLRANNGMIASCSDSGEVAFWAQDWTPRGRLSLPSSRVCHAAWSLDGALLAVCTKRDGGRLTVIDARAPQPHIVLSLPGRYETAEWCSDRRLFTITQTDKAGEPSFCSLIDPSLPADQCIVTHSKVADMRVLMSAANGQDRVALLMADRRLLVLDMPTFQPVFEFPASGRAHTVQTMLFDGDCITVPAPGGRFAVYTLGQSAPVYVPGVQSICYFMQWDHSGSGRDRLWACTEGALHLLDLRGSHPLSIATTHDPAPETHELAAPLSTQTLLQQASLTTALTQLQQTQQSPSHVLHSVQFHALTCCGVGVSPDGRTVVSGDFTGNLLAWPVAETVRAAQPSGQEAADAAHWAAHSQPSQRVCVSQSIRSVCWTPDGSAVLAGTESGNLFVWHVASNTTTEVEINTQHDPSLGSRNSGSITAIKFNHRGDQFAVSTSTGQLHVLAYQPGSGSNGIRSLLSFVAHSPVAHAEGSLSLFAEVWSLAWSPDDTRICTVSEDQTALIWAINMEPVGQLLQTLMGHTAAVTCADWEHTALGELLVTCSDDRTVRVYNAPDPSAGPQAECTLRAVLRSDVPDWHTLTYMSLETGGGGDRVACATQHGYLCVWSLRDERMVSAQRLHAGSIEGLAWHSGAGILAACSSDCTVSVVAMPPVTRS